MITRTSNQNMTYLSQSYFKILLSLLLLLAILTITKDVYASDDRMAGEKRERQQFRFFEPTEDVGDTQSDIDQTESDKTKTEEDNFQKDTQRAAA